MLIRLLDSKCLKHWESKKPISAQLISDRDCSPEMLSGWTEQDISLWEVEEHEGKPSLEEILVALCLQKGGEWEKVMYLQFPRQVVADAGLSLTPTKGATKNEWIDSSDTHYEIKGITGKKLIEFIYKLSTCDNRSVGLFKNSRLKELLIQAYKSQQTQLLVSSQTSQPIVGIATASTLAVPESSVGMRLSETTKIAEIKPGSLIAAKANSDSASDTMLVNETPSPRAISSTQ